MRQVCNHTLYSTREVEGERYRDRDGYQHYVIKIKCTGCNLTIGCRVTGVDTPHTYMPYYGPVPIKTRWVSMATNSYQWSVDLLKSLGYATYKMFHTKNWHDGGTHMQWPEKVPLLIPHNWNVLIRRPAFPESTRAHRSFEIDETGQVFWQRNDQWLTAIRA